MYTLVVRDDNDGNEDIIFGKLVDFCSDENEQFIVLENAYDLKAQRPMKEFVGPTSKALRLSSPKAVYRVPIDVSPS